VSLQGDGHGLPDIAPAGLGKPGTPPQLEYSSLMKRNSTIGWHLI
jgi:hypothetical protein